LQSVAVAAFRIVSWNKDVIVELVLIFPLPIMLIPHTVHTTKFQYYTWWVWACFGYPFGKGIKSSGN